MPKSVIAEGIDAMKAIGSDFFGAESADDIPFAKDDALVILMEIHVFNKKWMLCEHMLHR